jgi:serine/threonine protein phosphatase PrpC
MGAAIPDVSAISLQRQDRFIVSSDGFHGVLSSRMIRRSLTASVHLDDGIRCLFELALTRSRDNVTAIAVEYFGPARNEKE